MLPSIGQMKTFADTNIDSLQHFQVFTIPLTTTAKIIVLKYRWMKNYTNFKVNSTFFDIHFFEWILNYNWTSCFCVHDYHLIDVILGTLSCKNQDAHSNSEKTNMSSNFACPHWHFG